MNPSGTASATLAASAALTTQTSIAMIAQKVSLNTLTCHASYSPPS